MGDKAKDRRENVVRIIFRYDDCSARSSLALEQDFIRAFADCGAQVSLGVIPFVAPSERYQPQSAPLQPLTPEKSSLLREAAAKGHVEIVLHGWSHQQSFPGRLGEFRGLPLVEQTRRLREGRERLEQDLDARVTTFVPPWNRYDASTLDAMASVGLELLSADFEGPFPESRQVRYLPFTCLLSGLGDTLASAVRLRRLSPALVVMLHPFDFLESRLPQAWLSVKAFAVMLRQLSEHSHVRLCSLRQAAAEVRTPTLAEVPPYQRWYSLVRRLPKRHRYRVDSQALWTGGIGRRPTAAVWWYQSYLAGDRNLRAATRTLQRRWLGLLGRLNT